MYRKFIATIAAASIAITALGTTPARADDDDLARALAAILGVAVIGSIINDRNDDHVVTRTHRHQPRVHNPRRVHRPYVQPRPLPRRVERHRAAPGRYLLPGQCFRTFETRRGSYRGFGQRCLRNNFRHAHTLPNRCLLSLRTRNGHRNAYEARCLRNAGYRLARG